MAKLGSYEFPEIGLTESIELGQKIAREFAGEVSRQGLARSLGMSERGGAFSARLGSLRMWGVAGGRSRVRVTRDGLRAITPLSAKESEDARSALARNVSLFVELSSRLGEELYGPDRFAVLIEELTGSDRTEVARRLALIDRIFSEARPYLPKKDTDPRPQERPSQPRRTLPPVESPNEFERGNFAAISFDSEPGSAPSGAAERPRSGHPEPELVGDRIELGLPDGKLSLPETLANLDAALTVLWARRQLVAAIDASEGRPTPKQPRDFFSDR
ncbi:MAG: hypothetical protein O3B95_11070 [Chloroflexi bacterium]|nr:hypothetical protein [Chloroflexota bacterium]